MSAHRHPTRWNSIHRGRRAGRRWHSAVRRGTWSGGEDWALGLDLAGEAFARCADASAPRLPVRALGQASPAFVELFPALPASPSHCTIELADPSGRKLTLSLLAAPGPDLVALTQALWSGLR